MAWLGDWGTFTGVFVSVHVQKKGDSARVCAAVVCVCVCACVRACVRACMHACVSYVYLIYHECVIFMHSHLRVSFLASPVNFSLYMYMYINVIYVCII